MKEPMLDVELPYNQLETTIKQIALYYGMGNYADNFTCIKKYIIKYFPKYVLSKIEDFFLHSHNKPTISKFTIEILIDEGDYYGFIIKFYFNNCSETLEIYISQYITDIHVQNQNMIQIAFLINDLLLNPNNNLDAFLDNYAIDNRIKCVFNIKTFVIDKIIKRFFKEDVMILHINLKNNVISVVCDDIMIIEDGGQ